MSGKYQKAGRILLVALLAGGVLFLLVCKRSQPRPKTYVETGNTITELTFVFAEGDESGTAAMTDMVARFNDSHDNIVIRIQSGGSGTYDEKLKTLESVGEFPDLLETTNVSAYVRAGLLAELPEDIVNLFTEVTEFEGRVYTAPHTKNNTNIIVYNKTYFEDHGLQKPRTYEEFFQLCDAIASQQEMIPLAFGAKDLWHIGFWFNKIYNDQVISQDAEFIPHCYAGTKDFSDKSFQAVLTEMRRVISYVQPEWASTPDSKVTDYLINENTAMMYTGRHILCKLEQQELDFELGGFSIPSPDGKLRLVSGPSADGLAISAKAAQDPDKKAAAEEFLRFFFAKENYRYYCEALDILPTTVDAPDIQYSSVGQELLEDLACADSTGPMWNAEIGAKELPSDFRNAVYETVVEVLKGSIDIETACTQINSVWQRSTQKFNPISGVGAELLQEKGK